MVDSSEQYDDAMFAFSQGDNDTAIAGLTAILAAAPDDFDAQLALGMAWLRKGDIARAIVEGHKAEQLRPSDQLVHTNLSLFYLKAGNKPAAEHHALQSRLAAWRENMAPPSPGNAPDPELALQAPPPPPVRLPTRFPEMPWKKQPKAGSSIEQPPIPAPTPDP